MATGLAEILDLEQTEVHVYRGRSRPTSGSRPRCATRSSGGEVAGQALVGRTLPGNRRVDYLHSYFLRPRPRLADPLRGRPVLRAGGFWAGHSRALCRGSLFDRDGTLVASVMQEGLVRVASR